MSRLVEVGGHAVAVLEDGAGEPLIYLHGFADVHGSSGEWLPFHRALAKKVRLIAPACPGCGASEENEDIDTIEDAVFHCLQMLDALRVDRFHLAGASIGGWMAAEAPEAMAMFPDGRMTVERELLRYKMFRFASRVGFSPPYLHDRKLRDRLSRYGGPALVIAGEQDNLVPVAHARAYAAGLRNAELKLVANAGNSVAVERPDETASAVLSCVERAAALT